MEHINFYYVLRNVAPNFGLEIDGGTRLGNIEPALAGAHTRGNAPK